MINPLANRSGSERNATRGRRLRNSSEVAVRPRGARFSSDAGNDETMDEEVGRGRSRMRGRGGRGNRAQRPKRPRKPSRLGMIVGGWWNRLIGAVYSGSLSSQTEQYAAHNTTQDYIWNSVGLGAWGVVFPVLSVVTTQLLNVEQGGRFSMAFVTGTLLLFIANFGVRTYQASDISENHSFADYQACRVVTVAAMLLVGVLYC